jgi:hypothetical protein
MIVVRYFTLVALVLWIAAMVDARFGDLLRRVPLLPICGVTVIAGLFALKFLGPPPMAFVWRAAIAVLMLAIMFAAAFIGPGDVASLLATVDIGLGFLLLVWYVRE